ncbi:unnamed protein product [Lepeophtheirus salmonis]|uniref:Metalloendopeptidase n=2 Tax=Lepeophtheirus salmonis TaxID=72036 RepID=A0A7R8CN63_LEPSM|nr:seminal metalloprotease 1-like [Lepeophtheirus salmonis]CAB4060704.1 unnamed protein product [Lepeophtheirus salmonis]CAF2870063.1 unnamed protein product [Lepeophtheirus salmonis]
MKIKLFVGLHVFVTALAFDHFGDNSTSVEIPPCTTRSDDTYGMSRNMKTRIWPRKKVPYKISSGFTSSEKKVIYDAINHIQSNSCVRFRRKKWYNFRYVKFVTGGSTCYATGIGYSPFRRKTKIRLAKPGCINIGIVAHEILHVLGFEHEQNRPDRDRYVKIQWNNIKDNKNDYHQFIRSRFWREPIKTCNERRLMPYDNCAKRSTTVTYGFPYDYKSIMHYRPYSLTKNNKPTITKRNGGTTGIGRGSRLSLLDFKKLNRAYRCPAKTAKPCKNRRSSFYCRVFVSRRRCRRSKYRNRCRKKCKAC